ncbi:MAG: hypothetical protein M1548_10340 [Actinobacteria bacterium]|nr:hypothetical protein [Actinomycetota bacterium]
MQTSEILPEESAVKAKLTKESLAERLERIATNLDHQGNALADRLRKVEGDGINVVSGGIRRAAGTVRRLRTPDLLTARGGLEQSQPLIPIAVGLGAGLIVGLIIRKMVK